MRHTILALFVAVLALVAGLGVGQAQSGTYTMSPGETLSVQCASGLSGTIGQQAASLVCTTLVPTATVAQTDTSTPAPSQNTARHPPTNHEHGDAPPQWVLDHEMKPFTQIRESHTGYKGVLASDNGRKGVQSYLIAHILSTEAARSHGDHDYQVWFRHPDGTVLASQGQLDFSSDPRDITAPIPERQSDTGERPIALAERTPTDGCETWYSRPGALVFDLGWTICGRYQKFDGTILGGTGAVRGIDWVLVADRLPLGHPLRANCTVEFTVCRHSFFSSTKNYGAPGIVPIN